MRVAMYYNNRDVRIEERERPRIGPGEALVRVVSSGICGSDVMEWYRLKKAPLVLGHEIAAEVVEVGDGVRTARPGDRVFVSHHVPCNSCRYCLAGNHTVCETLHTTNFDPGGFAEYVRVPPLQTDRGLFHLPAAVGFDEGTLVEPLACVVRGQRVARLEPGQTVLVLGAGISGLLHIALAKALGAGAIVATDVHPYRLAAARRLGAALAVDAREDVPAAVRAATGGRLADLVIVCTGARPAFDQALESVERGGTIEFFATTEPGVDLPVPLNRFWRNGISLMPSYGASPRDLTVAIDLLAAGRIPASDLITHRLPLDQAAEGFLLVAEGAESIKVVLRP